MTSSHPVPLFFPALTIFADPALLNQVEQIISKEKETFTELKELASKHPYYK